MRSSQRVRKRAQEEEDAAAAAMDGVFASLEAAVAEGRKGGGGQQHPPAPQKNDSRPGLVFFTGAGLSASTGMSTFSTPGGLYDRAKKRLKMPASGDGSRLFHAKFFAEREGDAHSFLAEIATEALKAQPSAGHKALAELAQGGFLARHYTLNVDGLAEAAGMRVWKAKAEGGGEDDEEKEEQEDGRTVELHGSARRLVCRQCGATCNLTPSLLRDMRAGKPLPCPRSTSPSASQAPCPPGTGRTSILLYDDPHSALITPSGPVWRLLERDLAQAAAVVWCGISFEQSASVGYFTRVVRGLRRAAAEGRAEEEEEEQEGAAGGGEGAGAAGAAASPLPLPPQVIVNPCSEDAVFNLLSGAGKGELGEDVRIVELRMETDAALPALAARLLLASGRRKKSGGDEDEDEAAAAAAD